MATEDALTIPAGIPAIGEAIAAKYCVERVLGIGGMGVVLAARHLKLDESVAIKILLPELAKKPEVVERFMREARAAVRIKNEHVGRVYDVETLDNGTPYMVMECLHGSDLKELVTKDGPLDPMLAVDYVLQACEALNEAHGLGIVHRDLKPSNLYLAEKSDGNTTIKVLDFGIAKIADVADHSMTKTNTQMGTPFYMAPEQIQASRDIDARVDIWSLGVVLYELLTNKLPFEGETLASIAVAIVINGAPSVRAIRPEVSPELDAVIARCLQKDRDARFPSIAALAEALAPLASVDGVSSSQRILRAPRRPGSQASLPDIGGSGAIRLPPPSSPELLSAKPMPPPAAKTDGAWQQETGAKPARSRVLLAVIAAGLLTGGLVVALFVTSEGRSAGAPVVQTSASVDPVLDAAPASIAPVVSAEAAGSLVPLTQIASAAAAPAAPSTAPTTQRAPSRRPSSPPKPPPIQSARPTKREPLPEIH